MPSLEHQGLAKLLSESPRLVATLVRRVFGFDVAPDIQTVQAPETVREIDYPELLADGVVLVHGNDTDAKEAFVVEVQLNPDPDKRYSWPMYVAGIRRRLRCPVTLIVVTTSHSTARWCAKPIDLGRGTMTLTPLVIGPSDIPRLLGEDDALRNPELAVLAVIAHGREPGSEDLGRVALEASNALAQQGDERAILLIELIVAFLGDDALTQLESQMDLSTSPFAQRQFARGRQEGEAAGRIQALLSILDSRGLELTDEIRRMTLACTDTSQLDTWLRRAATAERATDVFS